MPVLSERRSLPRSDPRITSDSETGENHPRITPKLLHIPGARGESPYNYLRITPFVQELIIFRQMMSDSCTKGDGKV